MVFELAMFKFGHTFPITYSAPELLIVNSIWLRISMLIQRVTKGLREYFTLLS